jgi:hypothetical protein
MKSAKEMFAELGYEYEFINLTFGCVGHNYTKKKNEYYGQEIMFNICYNNISISNSTDETVGSGFEIEELKAIHQQMKELGWLKQD